MLTVSHGGERFPWLKRPTVFDVLCNEPDLTSAMYMNNVTFFNMKDNYTDINCHDNKIFKFHPTNEENTAGHYLTNVVCENCDKEMYFGFGEM
jgi:hypothetical protein